MNDTILNQPQNTERAQTVNTEQPAPQAQKNAPKNKTLLDNEIPAKFRDPETGDVRMDAFVKSYKNLEQKLSTQKKPPAAHSDYCIDCAHGMFVPDDEVNKRLHAMGLTEDQAQEVYDLAAERLMPMIAGVAGDFHADRELDKLITHYGGAEQWREIARQLLAFGRKNLPADVLDTLTSSYDGVLALEGMMQNGEPTLKRTRAGANTGMNEKDLQSMMRDPKYWRDKDPAFVAKVTEGFASMYSGE